MFGSNYPPLELMRERRNNAQCVVCGQPSAEMKCQPCVEKHRVELQANIDGMIEQWTANAKAKLKSLREHAIATMTCAECRCSLPVIPTLTNPSTGETRPNPYCDACRAKRRKKFNDYLANRPKSNIHKD